MTLSARWLTAGCLAMSAAALSAPADASTHHHKRAEHHTEHHRAAKTKKRDRKPLAPRPAAPAGVVTVPAGGIKVYCAGRRSPLMVRKATQGNGTTVTIICR